MTNTTLTDKHLADSALRLREALHFHRFQPRSAGAVRLAKLAGASAAYAAAAAAAEVLAATPDEEACAATAPAFDVDVIREAFEVERARIASLLGDKAKETA
jgi:hypothetical protein